MSGAITTVVAAPSVDTTAAVEAGLKTVYDDVELLELSDSTPSADCLVGVAPMQPDDWATLDSIVARSPQLPLVILAGDQEAATARERASAVGATDVVVADDDARFEALAHRVRGVVEHRRTVQRRENDAPSGSHLKDLYEVATDSELSFEEKADRMLGIGVDRLNVENAHLSTIDREPERYEIVASVGELPLSPGDIMDLPTTFCRKTIETDDVLAFSHASEQGWADDPAYQSGGIECYLGSRIVVGGSLSGTVCFLDRNPHDSFTEAEQAFVSLVARWLSHELERTRRENALDTLHHGTTELLRATTKENVCEVAVGIAGDMVDAPVVNAWLLDENETTLEPVASLGSGGSSMATTRADDAGDRLWAALDNGTVSEHDDVSDVAWQQSPIRSEVVVPLNDHGVLTAGSETAEEFDRIDISLLKMLGSNTVAALERTERVEELVAAHERARRIFESASDALLLIDPAEGGIIDYNDRAVDLLGYDESTDLHSVSMTEICRDDLDTFETLVAQVARNNRGWVDDLLCRRQDGKRVPAEVSAATVEFPDRDRILASLRDISERKRREQALNVFNRVLRHNIRNDMNVILGHASLIEAATDEQTVTDSADQIIQTGRELAAIGEKARTFQELDERETDLDHVDLRTTLEDVCHSLQSDYPAASFDIYGPETASAAVESTVDIAFVELCENAIKHATTDAPTVDIELTAVDDEQFVVTITDEGPGLPPQDCAVLEGGSETPLSHGSGLGLWLANWVVDTNGGEVDVVTSSENGTTIRLFLPAVPAERAAAVDAADDHDLA